MDLIVANAIRRYVRDSHAEELELLRTLARIPAPSHHEERRASFIAGWLHAHGARYVRIDDEKNVICLLANPRAERKASGDAQTLAEHVKNRTLTMYAAHMDVVFADEDELPLREDDERMYAPGVGDDTANLVNLLMATKFLLQNPLARERATRKGNILIVANTCEEGLGNLDGTRDLFGEVGEWIDRYFSFDLYLPQCISVCVASERYQIDVECTGGHSYHDYGNANAIEEVCSIIEDLYRINPPIDVMDGAHTTMNVGKIEGGTTINSIPSHAMAKFEFRSSSTENIEVMRSFFNAVIERHRRELALRDEAGKVTVTTLGVRPSAQGVDAEALKRMTERSARIVKRVTGQEPDLKPASTDANIPLSLGVPANTIGTVRGAKLHTRGEWIEKKSLRQGLEVVLRLMLDD